MSIEEIEWEERVDGWHVLNPWPPRATLTTELLALESVGVVSVRESRIVIRAANGGAVYRYNSRNLAVPAFLDHTL
jgi:hypothetical protein